MSKRLISIKTLVLFFVCGAEFFVGGCKKSCYYCEALYSSYRCTKNLDTTYFITVSYRDMQDSLNYYINQGFVCDTLNFYWTPYYVANPICKKEWHEEALAAGDKCRLAE